MIYLCVSLYLLVSGLSSVGFIMEYTSPDVDGRGPDITYCGVFWLTVLSLIPLVGVAGIILLLTNLVDTVKWPKCPVAFKGRTR